MFFDCLLVISKEVSELILGMYYSGLEDYSIDHRGDVGSWSREASMQGLATLLPMVARLDLDEEGKYLSDEDHAQLLAKLLQQSVEKIDRIRACAATAIAKVLYAKASPRHGGPEDYLLCIPHREKIMAVIDDTSDLNWLQPAQVYPRVVQLLKLKEYRTDLLLGFIVSAGGLTESLVSVFLQKPPKGKKTNHHHADSCVFSPKCRFDTRVPLCQNLSLICLSPPKALRKVKATRR